MRPAPKRPVEALFRRGRTRFEEQQRMADIMLVQLQLLASIDTMLEGLCSMANVPVDRPPGTVHELKRRPERPEGA